MALPTATLLTLGLLVAPTPAIAPVGPTLMPLAQANVIYNPPPPPDRGSPAAGASGSPRGGCPVGLFPLTALVPSVSAGGGQTTSDRPTFWVAVPHFLVTSYRVDLRLRTLDGAEYYRTSFTPTGDIPPGLVALPLPEEAPALEAETYYDWEALVYCNTGTPVSTGGWVQRVESPALGEETSADPVAQSQVYAAQGLWYDAVSALTPTLATAATPAATTAWAALLEAGGIADLAEQPLQGSLGD